MTPNEVMLVFWDAALKGALLLALAGAMTLALRRASAAVRHLVWSVAACGALLLPVLSFVLPEWRVPWVPDWRQPVLSASTGQGMPTRIPDALIPPRNEIPHVPASLGNVPPAAESGESSRPIALPVLRAIPVQPVQGGQFVRWLPAVWLTGAIASVLPLIIGWLQVLRLSRRSRPVIDPEWLEQLGTVAAELGLRSRGAPHDSDGSNCRVRLRISPHTRMPMTWGACRPILLLPADAEEWSPERRRVVLLHELAHVKRLDWFTQTLAYLACALYWFNPLVWFAARRMRIEREQACDDLVLRCGSRPSDYAVELLALATKIGGGGWVNWATVPMARRSSLEARLLSILDQKRSRTALTRMAVVAALSLLAAVAVPVAMMKAAPAALEKRDGSDLGSAPTVVNKVSVLPAQNGGAATLPASSSSRREEAPSASDDSDARRRDELRVQLAQTEAELSQIMTNLNLVDYESQRQHYVKNISSLQEDIFDAQGELMKRKRALGDDGTPAATGLNIALERDRIDDLVKRIAADSEILTNLQAQAKVLIDLGPRISDLKRKRDEQRAEYERAVRPTSPPPDPSIRTTAFDDFYVRKRDELWAKLAQTETELHMIMTNLNLVDYESQKQVYVKQITESSQEIFEAQKELSRARASLGNLLQTNSTAGSPNTNSASIALERAKIDGLVKRIAADGEILSKLKAQARTVIDIEPRIAELTRRRDEQRAEYERNGFSYPQSAMASPARSNPQSSASLVTSAATNVPPLERTVSLNAQQMPLKDVFAEVCRQVNLKLDLDTAGLEKVNVPPDSPVSISFTNEPLRYAVIGILRRFQDRLLVWELRGETMFVSSAMARQSRTAPPLVDWLKPLQDRGVNAALDDDGNVISLFAGDRATDEFLANAKTLPKLRELRIQGVKDITLEGLAHLGELPALETLQLWSSMPQTNAGWGDEALRQVSRIKTLRDLEIDRCGLTDSGARALETMTQLRALNLSGNQLTSAALTSLAALTNLQKLDLGYGVSGMGLQQLSGLTQLEELSVFASGISGRFIAFPRLRVLSVSGERFTDADFDAIVQCRELRRLVIAGISDAGLRRIAELPELRQLEVGSEAITAAGIAHLKASPKLERLSIRTRQGDEAVRQLSEIKSLVELTVYGPRWLGVEDQQELTVEGLLQLKKLPKLRSLEIYGIQTATGVLGLRELTQLQTLTLNGYNITDKEVELLKRAMPGTHVGSMFGRGILTLAGEQPQSPPPPLPSASVFLSGRVLDDVTGEAVTNCVLEFGVADPDKPGEVIWGAALPALAMEVSGNNPADLSQFWGECFRTGKVWARILAGGRAPELLTPNPVESPVRLKNLVVRMKRGGDLRGVVVDHTGKPAAGMRVYLADQQSFSLSRGTPGSLSDRNSTTTDAAGRFALAGGDGTEQRLVAASPDGQLFAVAPRVGPAREVKISLPQPATLIVRYDIPDDSPVARIGLNYETQNLDPVVWKEMRFSLGPTVTNGQEIVLTNLTPGDYRLTRGKTGLLGNRRGGGGVRGAILDMRTLTLEASQTQRVDIVRTRGHSIRGEVMGLRATGAPGASIYAFSAGTTNDLVGMLTGLQRPIDLVTCSNDGQFLMGRLEPGAYTIVAVVNLELDWGMPRPGRPDYVGAAEVNITSDSSPPAPLKIELLPWKLATNQPAARPSGGGRGGTVPERRNEESNRQAASPPNPQSAVAIPARTNPQSSESLVTSAATEVPPLERKVSLNAHQMPLKDALAEVCRQAKVELDLDREAFEFEGQTVDRPVTALIVDEPLESAVGTILDRLPWDHFIFQSLRGGKLLVSGHRFEQERTKRALPDWLKPLGHGVRLDDDHQVTAITVGGKADDEFLARLKTLPKLRELRLDTTQGITPAGLAHLAEFPALEKLYLYYVSHAARVGNEALRVATRIKTLRDLSVGNCGVTDDGVRVLEGMTQLTALSLLDNPLTDASLKSLAGLTNLQRLDLGGTQITDTGLKQLSRLTELRELFVGRLPISDNALVLPHLRPLGRYLEVPEAAVIHPLDARAILDAPGWGAAVEGFQVRLRVPEATVRAGKIPRLLVDIANQGSRQLQCIANSWCWELEVDGVPYLANGSRYPQASGYSESGGMLLDVLPGQPWANLPLVLNVAWRKASELGEIRDRFGGSGMVVPSNPQPLRLTPGKHTLRLTVVGLPKFAGSTGPVLAVSNPVEIEVLAEGAADKTQRELRDVTIRAAGGQVHLQLEDGTGITANEIKLAVTGVIRMDAPIHGEVIGEVGLRFGLPGIAHPESAISNEVSQGPLTIKASGSELTIISRRSTSTASALHVSSGRLLETSALTSAPESAVRSSDPSRPFVVKGRVTDEQGHGLEGVTITAHCGMGTLLPTGETKSEADGRYTLRFREGMTTQRDGQRVVGVQAATISPRKAGFFETNLHRGGDLLMADKLPAPGEDVGWKVEPKKVVLTNQPYELNFVMRPAATLNGRLVDPNNKPLTDRKIYLTGDQLPPSSSVLASATTDQEGRFRFEDVPTSYAWKFSVTDERKDVLSKVFFFSEPREHRVALSLRMKTVTDAARLNGTSFGIGQSFVDIGGSNAVWMVEQAVGHLNALDDTPKILIESLTDWSLQNHGSIFGSLQGRRPVSSFQILFRGDTNVASDLFLLTILQIRFGPVIEREMAPPVGLERSYLDLETGDFVSNSPPGDVTLLVGESDLRVRHGVNMAVVLVASNRWDATEDQVLAAVFGRDPQAQVRLGGTESQRTWFFKTREGSMGKLQILPVEEKPGTVVIRWKLVNPPTDPRSSRREEAPFPSSNSSESLVTSDATGMVAVSGSVLDAETHQPIERFTFKSGGPGDPDYLYWRKAQEGRHGAYQIELRYSDYVKVEAPGYMPEMIRIVRGATNQLTCNFELRKGESFVGKVVDWDGRPEAGAQLTFREDHGVFHLSGHKLVSHTFDSDYMWQNLIALSDSAGGFKLRAMPGVKSLVVLDEKGFAEVPRMGIAQGMTIRLQPWGKNAETAVALGLLVRLQTDRPKWRLGETPSLRLDIRNVGPGRFQSSTNTHLWRIEVDGEWYDSDQEIGLLQLEPGQAWTNRAVILDSAWTSVGKDGSTYMFGPDAKGLDATLYGADERGAWNSHPSWTSPPPGFLRPALRLSPGKHAIRLAVFAATVGDGTVGTIRALSNPVEIEMAAQNDSGSSRREQAPTAVEGDTERQREARAKLGVFDAYYERKREELKATLDKTEAELKQILTNLNYADYTDFASARENYVRQTRELNEDIAAAQKELTQRKRMLESGARTNLSESAITVERAKVTQLTSRIAADGEILNVLQAQANPLIEMEPRITDLIRKLAEQRRGYELYSEHLQKARRADAISRAEADLVRIQALRDKYLVSETTLREAQASLDLARAEASSDPKAATRVRLQQAESDLARLTELRNANLVSTSELEAAQSKLALLGAEAAGDSAAVGRLKVPHAEADLARVQELRDKKLVSETTLREAQANLDLARAEAAATGWGEPREGISVRLRTPTSNWSGDDQFLMIDLKTDGAEFSQNDSFGRWVVNGHNLVLEWDGQIFLLDPVSRQFAFTSAIARSKSLTNLAHLQFRPVAHEALALPDSLVQGRFAVRATSLADLQPMWGLVLRAYENRAFDLSAGKHTIRIGFPLKVQMISTTPPSLGRNWAWSRPVEIEIKRLGGSSISRPEEAPVPDVK